MFIKTIKEEENYIVNVLVKSLQNDVNKDTLWRLFGETIYNNLKKNIGNTKVCEVCGERFKITNNRGKYCENCANEIIKMNDRNRKKEQKNSKCGI